MYLVWTKWTLCLWSVCQTDGRRSICFLRIWTLKRLFKRGQVCLIVHISFVHLSVADPWFPRPLADPRGRQGRAPPLGVQILSFSCSFWQKKLKNNSTLGVGAPHSGKSWIRHCLRRRGAILLFSKYFAENCLKMKEIGLGLYIPSSPAPDPPLSISNFNLR